MQTCLFDVHISQRDVKIYQIPLHFGQMNKTILREDPISKQLPDTARSIA